MKSIDQVMSKANSLVDVMTARENRRALTVYFVLGFVASLILGFKIYYWWFFKKVCKIIKFRNLLLILSSLAHRHFFGDFNIQLLRWAVWNLLGITILLRLLLFVQLSEGCLFLQLSNHRCLPPQKSIFIVKETCIYLLGFWGMSDFMGELDNSRVWIFLPRFDILLLDDHTIGDFHS